MGIVITIIIVGILIYFAMNLGKSKAQTKSGQSHPYEPESRTPRRTRGGSKYGKWIGGGLGWAFGGPIGGILGFVFGSMYDNMKNGQFQYVPGQTQTRPADFSVSLLILAAAVMKADNRVMKSELDYVKSFFTQQLGSEQAAQHIHLLKDILNQEIDLFSVCGQVKNYMDYSSRLQLIHFLFGISYADGHFHKKEIHTIDLIGQYLGISSNEYQSIKSMFIKDTHSAYKILDVSTDATDDEVKKAYHKMAIKYHPDKVSHLGDDYRKAAKEKFQELQNAYDQVKKERGIK